MQFLHEIILSQSFLEKTGLLLLGAILTGILVPLIKSRMDHSKFERQKLFEAKLSRQQEIIRNQTDFLSKFAKLIWEYQYLVLQVSYDRIEQDEKRYNESFQKYDNESWELLKAIRAIIGESRWFTSDVTYNRLVSFYENWLITLDLKLMVLVKEPSNKKDWKNHHDWLYNETTRKSDDLISELSADFDLK